MRAIDVDVTTGKLVLIEMPVPVVQDREVLIKIQYSALNRFVFIIYLYTFLIIEFVGI
jgi:hypothetical protein